MAVTGCLVTALAGRYIVMGPCPNRLRRAILPPPLAACLVVHINRLILPVRVVPLPVLTAVTMMAMERSITRLIRVAMELPIMTRLFHLVCHRADRVQPAHIIWVVIACRMPTLVNADHLVQQASVRLDHVPNTKVLRATRPLPPVLPVSGGMVRLTAVLHPVPAAMVFIGIREQILAVARPQLVTRLIHLAV